jgi:hypothetical protein
LALWLFHRPKKVTFLDTVFTPKGRLGGRRADGLKVRFPDVLQIAFLRFSIRYGGRWKARRIAGSNKNKILHLCFRMPICNTSFRSSSLAGWGKYL